MITTAISSCSTSRAATPEGRSGLVAVIAVWLWLTVLFANFAEAIAEGRGKAQANALRATRTTTLARRRTATGLEDVPAPELQRGNLVVVEDFRRRDPRRRRGHRRGRLGRRVRDHRRVRTRDPRGWRRSLGSHGWHEAALGRLVVEVTQEPGKSFLDRMIALVEGAERRKTPNEIALNILLAGLTITFVAAVVTLAAVRDLRGHAAVADRPDRAARRADPDDHRRAALGDRDRRHG